MIFRSAREKASPIALATLRIIVGIIMFAHGWDKVAGFEQWQGNVAGMGVPFPELMAGMSAAAELGGGIALILGALTPLAALVVMVNLIVAIALVHLGNGLFARNDGWEYPLTLAAVALYFVIRGAGPLSVDGLVRRARAAARREPEPVERDRRRPPTRRPAETTA